MKEKYKKYLPIGSVVLLENAKKKLMITGFCVVDGNDIKKRYDYSGCFYPEGIISKNTILFNHDQIDTIYAIGFSNEEEKAFKNKLNQIVNNEMEN